MEKKREMEALRRRNQLNFRRALLRADVSSMQRKQSTTTLGASISGPESLASRDFQAMRWL